MMRYSILDLSDICDGSYRNDNRFKGMAASYLRWELTRLGVGDLIMQDYRDSDIILVTLVSVHVKLNFKTLRNKLGIKPHQKVILGGQAAMSPKVIEDFADVICVGEGRRFLVTLINDGYDAVRLLPNSWIKGETREVIPDFDFPFNDIPPINCRDGQIRIFASRGCKKKCLFCSVGWERPYLENSIETVLRLSSNVAEMHGKDSVNYITNDMANLSYSEQLIRMNSKHSSSSFNAVSQLIKKIGFKRYTDSFNKSQGTVRLGIEAPSERLRHFIGKPIKTRELFDLTCKLQNNGIKVKWFMICGLPGETNDDYEELKKVILLLRKGIQKGVLHINFTSFIPYTSTPLFIPPLTDDYWERMQTFFDWCHEGYGYTRRVMILNGNNPKTRLKYACNVMGCEENELRLGWLYSDPPNWRVAYQFKHKIRRAYNVYAKKVGLPIGKD